MSPPACSAFRLECAKPTHRRAALGRKGKHDSSAENAKEERFVATRVPHRSLSQMLALSAPPFQTRQMPPLARRRFIQSLAGIAALPFAARSGFCADAPASNVPFKLGTVTYNLAK